MNKKFEPTQTQKEKDRYEQDHFDTYSHKDFINDKNRRESVHFVAKKWVVLLAKICAVYFTIHNGSANSKRILRHDC